jgi:hypothetical protein
MTDSEKLTTNAEPVVVAQALLAHNITDQAILNYITKRWNLGASNAIAALGAERALLDDHAVANFGGSNLGDLRTASSFTEAFRAVRAPRTDLWDETNES